MAQYMMPSDQMPSDQPLLSRSLLWAGAVLMGAAALLGVAGSALFGAAAAIGLGRHVRGAGLPPSELAMHHWRRAKTAARAGADSWRGQGGQMPVPPPRQPTPARMG
jgi:hypothetical protein